MEYVKLGFIGLLGFLCKGGLAVPRAAWSASGRTGRCKKNYELLWN